MKFKVFEKYTIWHNIYIKLQGFKMMTPNGKRKQHENELPTFRKEIYWDRAVYTIIKGAQCGL